MVQHPQREPRLDARDEIHLRGEARLLSDAHHAAGLGGNTMR